MIGKNYIALFIVLISLGCSTNNLKKHKPLFLVGKWKRINDKPNQNTFEIWNKDLKGTGYTLSENKKVFEEQLEIIKLKDTFYLKVTGVNDSATLFQFTSQTKTSFTCENPKNEFPKKIKYWLENDTLKALVSSDDFSIDFLFKKSN